MPRLPRLAAALALVGAAALPAASPVVIAHRGASGYLPEHTLVAVAAAHAQGPDYIEQDVVLTRDDVPVVIHDPHLDTVTDVAAVFPGRARADGRYYAIDFTLAEIRRLTVHSRVKLPGGEDVYPGRFPASIRIPHLEVPTLEEEIQLIQGMNHATGREVGLYVELKAPAEHRQAGRDLPGIVLEVLARHGYRDREDRVFLQCFDPATLRRLRREHGSRLKQVQLVEGRAWAADPAAAAAQLTPAGLREIATYADGVGPSWADLLEAGAGGKGLRPAGVVAAAQAAGLEVHPYTLRRDALPAGVRSHGHACQLLFRDLRVDGIFTDFPDLAVRFLERSGLRGLRAQGARPRGR